MQRKLVSPAFMKCLELPLGRVDDRLVKNLYTTGWDYGHDFGSGLVFSEERKQEFRKTAGYVSIWSSGRGKLNVTFGAGPWEKPAVRANFFVSFAQCLWKFLTQVTICHAIWSLYGSVHKQAYKRIAYSRISLCSVCYCGLTFSRRFSKSAEN